MKKIAMIDPSFFTWKYDEALIGGLLNQGHEVILYTKHLAVGDEGKGVSYICEFFYPGFHSKFMKALPRGLYVALKGMTHLFSMGGLYLRLHGTRPDVIHFQWCPLPLIDRIFVPLLRRIAPVVMTVHDSSPFNNSPTSKIQAVGATQVLKKFDGLIVHTENARRLLANYGIPIARISKISHGRLGSVSVAPGVPEIGSIDGRMVVLLFGHLKHYKGADVLIRALALMSESSRAKVLIRIVGKPEMDTQPLFDLARSSGVEAALSWDLRFVHDSEVAAIFSTSDVTVMPYRNIDASGVLMVALSIGRPIVASNLGLFAELLEDGKHGYLLPPEDPIALAGALTALAEDAGLRRSMGWAVRDLSASIEGWDEIAVQTVKAYDRCDHVPMTGR